ncbi:MAG: universal stress protein [Anaerolineales bacterium]|nr:universal stress protein [Chloroflexota bacterium]MBL6983123.1 universal stress protein [Anaerolineales bacterium]
MSYEQKTQYTIALEDFRRARRQAATSAILRRIKGQPVTLLPFDEVLQRINSQESHELGLHYIPLEAIIGSVGRYTEFTRDFLPLSGSLKTRWARVKSIFGDMKDMPPIQVYKIGDAYFVLDGNHRVSIARQRGATEIRAFVTEICSSIDITPETDLDSIILAAEYEQFLERTQLKNHTEDDLKITSPGRYQIIEHEIEQIQTQQKNESSNISFPEAAKQWYRDYYLPVRSIIRTHDLLRDFPKRTETDLYVWIAQHQEKLKGSLGWKINPEDVALDLAEQYSPRPEKRIARWGERIRESVTPTPIETGPKTGEWRRQHLSVKKTPSLFKNILVTISGESQNWSALQQALIFAKLEKSNLLGLHILSNQELIDSAQVQQIREEFDRINQEKGIPGEFAVDVGEITPTIIKRSRWSDLVVVHLAHPPGQDILNRLASGFHRLVQRCPRPVLVVPKFRPALNKLLLAYDGSPKADEALFLAAYLAGKWGLPLTVLIILEGDSFPKTAIARARWYMNTHRIIGDIHIRHGNIPTTILDTTKMGEFDLVIMGGYSHSPILELVIGSSVNDVLRATECPILICR